MARNPFQYLDPVQPDSFVGRWSLVKRIALDLVLDGGNAHAIIGGRRCGKSSLLLTIAHQLRQPATSELGDYLALPLVFDLKSVELKSAEMFFARMLDEVRRRVDNAARRRASDSWPKRLTLDADWFGSLAAAPALDLRDFEDAMGYILDQFDGDGTDKPARMVMLLDEIDETLNQPWTEALFNQLRSLLSFSDLKSRVRMLISGSRRFLDKMSDRGSPLFNVLKLHYLEAFDEAGLGQLTARAEGLSAEAGRAVWQHSGGHPFLAQYLLYHLWESGIAGADASAVGRLASRFINEQAADLEGWAHGIEKTGLKVYAVLAPQTDWIAEDDIRRALNDPTLNAKRGLTALCYHGLAVHDDGWLHYRRAGDMFRNWFEAQRDLLLAESPPVEDETGRQIVINVGDSINVGNIEGSENIAIGKQAQASKGEG